MRARAIAALPIALAALAFAGCLVLNPDFAEDTAVDLTDGTASSSAATSTTTSTTTSTATSAASAASTGAVTGTSTDASTGDTTMPAPACGNVVIDPGELCDDGNADEIAPDEAQDLLCPPDQVIVATFGSSGSVIDNLGIRCAPLQLMPAADGYHIVPGQTGDLGPHGGGNAPNFDDPCAGAMRGAHVNLGSWVNAFAARCSTLTVE